MKCRTVVPAEIGRGAFARLLNELISLLGALLVMGVLCSSPANAALVFKTSDSPFDPGVNNQGWWSANQSGFDFNDNYVTGLTSPSGGNEVRDFFTFDLRSLDLSGRTIVSALLQVNRGGRGNDPTETIAFFEVSTDAATLNNNSGTSAAIFDDLGTGTVYGTYVLRTDGPQYGRAAFRLNQAAILGISGAAGSFFSIGGALQSLPGYMFGFTGGGDQRLVLCLDTDPDGDGDGVCDSADNCPATANPEQGDFDGDEIGDTCDDSDGDGVLDSVDNCPLVFNSGQQDADGDGNGDSCDFCPGVGSFDADGDGVCDGVDNCRFTGNPSQADADGDGAGNACDNCPDVPNPDQVDSDFNGIGDACALCPPYDDFDADNVCSAVDNCPFNRNPDQADADGDGFGDACDTCAGFGQSDCDADGACDQADNCFCVPNPGQADGDGDGDGDTCDNCPATPNQDQANVDGDTLGDACDPCPADPMNDLDGDGLCGNVDNCPFAPNPGQEDSDGNGIGDACTGGRSLVVNSFGDAADDRPGDGLCATAQDQCSLRAAVQETNALIGMDVITLPAGIYELDVPGVGEDAARSGDLDVTDDLTIVGAGRDSTIIDAAFPGATPRDRAMEIIGASQVQISGVTIRNGFVGGSGGGILNGDRFAHASKLTLRDCMIAANASSFGGGILNEGTLEIFNSRIEDNAADNAGSGLVNNSGATLTLTDSTVSDNGGPGARFSLQGGGINNRGTMTVLRSTVMHNTSGSEGGGGIWNAGVIEVVNSTISGNTADTGGVGGGIKMLLGTLTVNSSTITDNLSSGLGGGVFNQSGTVVLQNTIIAANRITSFFGGADCRGPIISGGYNLVGNSSDCSFSPSIGDLIGIDPGLGLLQDNGGPTWTHGLLSGSPAIDAGSSDCPEPATDQRGIGRPQGSACDIGAFEFVMTTQIVGIDIKPGSQTNPINLRSRGVIPVAILSSPELDAPGLVDRASLTFGRSGDEPSLSSCEEEGEDVNLDGLPDLVCLFWTRGTGLREGDTQAILKGNLLDAREIMGSDSVRIVSRAQSSAAEPLP